MNVYSDSPHTNVNFLSDKALNISNLLYIEGDFNVRDAKQDFLHPVASQALKNLADSYSLVHFIPALSVPTHYLDIQGHAYTVIDLIFLYMSCAQVSYCIKPDLR